MLSGHRSKIGVIIPSTNTVVEPDFYAMAPDGVSFHFARLMLEYTPDILKRVKEMTKNIEISVKKLESARMDVIAFGCTTGSYLEGGKWNEEITKRMAEVTKAKVITTSTAVIEALKCLEINKVAVLIPLIDLKFQNIEVQKRITKFRKKYYYFK